jgi:predicted GNAT family acetyltransferase
MDIQVRKYNHSTDYEQLSQWWNYYPQWQPPHPKMLSKKGWVGVVDGKRSAACWQYATDSCIAWIEFIVGNPFVSKEMRGLGIDACVQRAIIDAKESGFSVIFTSSNHKKLIERLKRNEFVQGDTEVTQLIFNGG